MIDTADIDRGCGADEKVCTGHCVSIHDPAYGCTTNSCEPCELNYAIPRCADDNSCKVSECLFGFGCPNANGCPVDLLSDPQNCGECYRVCRDGTSCQDGQCRAKQ